MEARGRWVKLNLIEGVSTVASAKYINQHVADVKDRTAGLKPFWDITFLTSMQSSFLF